MVSPPGYLGFGQGLSIHRGMTIDVPHKRYIIEHFLPMPKWKKKKSGISSKEPTALGISLGKGAWPRHVVLIYKL